MYFRSCILLTILAIWAASPAGATDPAKPLRLGGLPCQRILYLGNSITLHRPLASIGWTGDWGMAASAREKDYVSLPTAKIEKAVGGRPEIKVRNIADFEREYRTFDVVEGLKTELAWEADIIVVAIGENVPQLVSQQAKDDYAAAYAELLTHLQGDRKPLLLVRSSFWANDVKDTIMREACKKAGGDFVDISDLGSDKANYARSERAIEHVGVGYHPGDRGMQTITDALWTAIEKHTATISSEGE